MWVVTIPHRLKEKNQKNLHIVNTDALFGVYALTGSVCVNVGAHMLVGTAEDTVGAGPLLLPCLRNGLSLFTAT